MVRARKYYPGMGTGLAEVKWLDDEDLEFGDDADATFSWDGTDLNLLPLVADTGRFNIGDGTLFFDVRVFGSAAGNYFEYDASADQVNAVIGARNVVGNDFALSIDATTTFVGANNMVGLNVVMRPQDSVGVGTWLSAIYASVVMAADGVAGYITAAELEITLTGAYNPCEYAVLGLNNNDSNVGGDPVRSYILMHDYGTRAMNTLLDIRDHVREAANDAVLVSQMPETPFDTAIRCEVAGAPVWLYGSTVGPAAIEDFQWIGTAVGNYMEYDASEDQMNIVIGARAVTGNDFALSIDATTTFDGAESMVGLNIVMRPQDSVGVGTWLSAIFANVTMAADAVGGYISICELEITLTGGYNPCDYSVLALNNIDNNTGNAATRQYIHLRDYGAREMDCFLNIDDVAIGTNSATVLVSTSGAGAQSHGIRIRLPDNSIAWIMVTATAP